MQIQIRSHGFPLTAREEQLTRGTLACSAPPSSQSLERLERALAASMAEPTIDRERRFAA